MKGTHTLAELRGIRGFRMRTDGVVVTLYGICTMNFWTECSDGLYRNTHCKYTLYRDNYNNI